MKYPYTDFQIMNLDFLLQRMAAMQAEIDELKQQGGGGGGSDDYNDLNNKPQINGNTLSGNKTAAQLGLATPGDIPTIPVTSVNTKTGAVVLDADDVGAIEAPDLTGASPGQVLHLNMSMEWVPATITAPVTSVNTQTGAVVLTAANVGAIAAPATPSAGDYLAWDSVNSVWVAQALPLYDGS